jgi:hypothetical protein
LRRFHLDCGFAEEREIGEVLAAEESALVSDWQNGLNLAGQSIESANDSGSGNERAPEPIAARDECGRRSEH